MTVTSESSRATGSGQGLLATGNLAGLFGQPCYLWATLGNLHAAVFHQEFLCLREECDPVMYLWSAWLDVPLWGGRSPLSLLGAKLPPITLTARH